MEVGPLFMFALFAFVIIGFGVTFVLGSVIRCLWNIYRDRRTFKRLASLADPRPAFDVKPSNREVG